MSAKRNNDRREEDLRVALAMKGETMTTIEHAVDSALDGLHQAKRMNNMNRLEEALSLYQQSIEDLINVVKSVKERSAKNNFTPTSQSGIPDLKSLTEITNNALHEAETIKENLQVKKTSSNHPSIRRQRPGYKKCKSEYKVRNNERALAASKSLDDQWNQVQPGTKPRSRLDYNKNDPLINTIKSDIYVDSSSLTTTWDMVSGLSFAKRSLQEAVILPILRPDLYTGLRSPPRGVLLYGPPGTGKTLLVRAAANESKCILFACSASSLTSKWVGEGEKLVRTLFKMAADVAPSIVFLDELDSLLGRRKEDNSETESSRRFKTEFMIQMDGIATGKACREEQGKTMLIVGATNCPWSLDEAILRRFSRQIYVPLPDSDARISLWERIISKAEKSNQSLVTDKHKKPIVTSKDIQRLSNMTEGFSASDIASISNEAAFGPLRSMSIDDIKSVDKVKVRPIEMKDFVEVIKRTQRSVSKEMLDRYTKWEKLKS